MSRHRRRKSSRTVSPIWIGLAVLATVVVHGSDTGISANSFKDAADAPQEQRATKAPAPPPPTKPPTEAARTSRGEGRTSLSTVPATGSGVLRIVGGHDPFTAAGRRITYRVELEQGLPFDPEATAATIHRTLIDPRGWQPIEKVAFERVDTASDLRIIVASPGTTDRLCHPLDTRQAVGDDGTVAEPAIRTEILDAIETPQRDISPSSTG